MEQQNNQPGSGTAPSQPALTPITPPDESITEGANNDDQLDRLNTNTESADENPDNVANIDDLHEIQASDDINEPDPEAELPQTDAAPQKDENDAADDTAAW